MQFSERWPMGMLLLELGLSQVHIFPGSEGPQTLLSSRKRVSWFWGQGPSGLCRCQVRMWASLFLPGKNSHPTLGTGTGHPMGTVPRVPGGDSWAAGAGRSQSTNRCEEAGLFPTARFRLASADSFFSVRGRLMISLFVALGSKSGRFG